MGCDLLENTYLCGSNNNCSLPYEYAKTVVICLKIRTFVVATTTPGVVCSQRLCCDLLENTYLCGSNNNLNFSTNTIGWVVICLKIRTFVVATTTCRITAGGLFRCDLLENTYLCGSNNNDFALYQFSR